MDRHADRDAAIPCRRNRSLHDHVCALPDLRGPARAGDASSGWRNRSEEHTSALQSLMRISYAVFCLKKKNYNHHNKREIHSSKREIEDNAIDYTPHIEDEHTIHGVGQIY